MSAGQDDDVAASSPYRAERTDGRTRAVEKDHVILFMMVSFLLLLRRILKERNAPWPSVCELVIFDAIVMLSVLLIVLFVVKLMEDAREAKRRGKEEAHAAKRELEENKLKAESVKLEAAQWEVVKDVVGLVISALKVFTPVIKLKFGGA